MVISPDKMILSGEIGLVSPETALERARTSRRPGQIFMAGGDRTLESLGLRIFSGNNLGGFVKMVATLPVKGSVPGKEPMPPQNSPSQACDRAVFAVLNSAYMMVRFVLLIVLTCGLQLAGLAQAAETYAGKLDPLLVPDMVHVYMRVYSTPSPKHPLLFEVPPGKGAAIVVGTMIDQRMPAGGSPLVLVEPPGADPYLWFDHDRDGTYEKAERQPLARVLPDVFRTTLRLALVNTFYKDLPIFIEYKRGLTGTGLKPTDRLISQSVFALAMAKVDIRGRSVLFQYPFQPQTGAISTTEGLFGIDSDGDGAIRDQQFSIETSSSANDEAVFPLRDIFVSTSAIDMQKGTVTVRRRDASEYTRVDLSVGKEMPDFTFTDLDGETRRLAEFRGKYLLLDFWGVWCRDCTIETPYHVDAYKRFRSRGLEILGLNTDEKLETVKAYIAKNKMAWPQATNESIKALAETTYRIQEYPSTILLGPDGRVIVLDQKRLRGEALIDTLNQVLPK